MTATHKGEAGDVVDLRSDTITHPTGAMRESMALAEVGDDVFGEDPTITRLEEMGAELMGKEAAVYVPSGTMANLSSLLAHCQRGDEVIMGDRCHTFLYEAGGSAAVGSIHPRTVPNKSDGTMGLSELEAAIRPDGQHFPPTRAIYVENTHNRCSGAVIPESYLADVRSLANNYRLVVHMDGARLFNAAVALGVPARNLARHVDTVSFCLSKGLAAPVGSVLAGPAEFIIRARRARKVLGGGMRQAGVIAAAGIVALETMVDRLADDHSNARRLAQGIAPLPGITLDSATVQSNIVIFGLDRADMTPAQLAEELERRGVRLLAIGGQNLRAVTHYMVDEAGVERAVAVFSDLLG